MSHDYEKEIEKHKQFQEESHLRVNKFLAERDPLYEIKYQDKRSLLVVQLDRLNYEIQCIEDKVSVKLSEKKKILDQLQKLDDDRKNWEPM